MLKDIIPAEHRSKVYGAYALAIVVLGALAVGFATAGASLPTAVVVAEKVLLYLGGAMGLLAKANVPSQAPVNGPVNDE